MATTFSFEEGLTPQTFKPASRSRRRGRRGLGAYDPTDYTPGRSDKRGELPKDPTIRQMIAEAADEFGVPQEYGFALAQQESGYNPAASNSEFGASGIMQYIPQTAAKLGLDPSDPKASVRMAMQQFKEQMDVGGTDWAIKHHFAGPDKKGHGRKTRQYLADVVQRARDIAAQLKGGEAPTREQKKVLAEAKAIVEEEPSAQSDTFSFEEGLDERTPFQEAAPVAAPVEAGFVGKTLDYAGEALSSGWETFTRRLADQPNEYLGQKKIKVKRTPTEIERIIKEEKNAPWYRKKALIDQDDPAFWEKRREALEYETIVAPSPEREVRRVDHAKARQKEIQAAEDGDWFDRLSANFGNPMDAFTSESLPATFLENAIQSGGQDKYKQFMKARQVTMQENIVAHPEKYPKVAVDAAKQAIETRKAKQEPGVAEMWENLKKAAIEDPAAFAGQLARALVADPEMILAPIGVGLKPIAGTSRLIKGTEAAASAAGRGAKVAATATKVADKIIDAGSTGAAMNLAMEMSAAGAEDREAELGFAALTGGVLSGTIGAFVKGASAVDSIKAGNVTAETLGDALKDVADLEVTTESLLRQTTPIDNRVKHQIEEATGIKFESDRDLKAYLEIQRKEWRKLFEERDLNGQYQSHLAQQRMSYTETRALDATRARQAAQRQAEIEQAYAENSTQRAARFGEEYEQALAAREQGDMADLAQQAIKEDTLVAATKRLDEQDIIDAAYNGDTNVVKQAMVRAAQRDAKLAMPKWQRGEVDPRLLARVGIGGLFAGTAYALAPEDRKMQTAFAAGLAGLAIPGGGHVLRRMRQSGAMSLEGDLIDMGNNRFLKKDFDPVKFKERESEVIKRVIAGDQGAFKELYNSHVPRIQRYVKNFVRDTAPRIGVDVEDVAQEAMLKAYQKIGTFQEGSSFSTWLHSIARNTALDAIDTAKSQKGGGQYDFVGTQKPGMKDPYGGDAYSRDVFEEGAGSDPSATPEAIMARQSDIRELEKILEKIPEMPRTIFLLNRFEQYTAQEIADQMGLPLNTVLSHLKRVGDHVTERLQKRYGATKQSLESETGEPVKRGRGRPKGSLGAAKRQSGEIDPALLKTAGIIIGGAGAGYLYSGRFNKDEKGRPLKPDDPRRHSRLTAAVVGAGTGLLLFGAKGAGIKNISQHADDLLGASSTRILNKSKAIHKRILTAERNILGITHEHFEKVDPFLSHLKKLPKEGRDVLARALMTGKGHVINKIMDAFNDPELKAKYKDVRSVLDSLGDQLVHLKRFAKGNLEYFPRIVKDKEGLFKAIGKAETESIKQILDNANVESMRERGRPLSEMEESAIINQALFVDKRGSQPGFAKNRGIEEITPELLEFYASPEESLHSYISAAVQDIEGAKFFGDYGTNVKKGNFEYLDVDRSVKNMMAEEIKSGKLSDDDAAEIADILRTRFKEGMRAESDFIRNVKNIGNIGLLGNFWSAATQMADVGAQVYTQGLMPTLEAVARQISGKKLIDVKDFGLVDHISEEFSGQLRTSRWVNQVFRKTLFAGVDQFGKNTALNAAIIKAKKLVLTDGGIKKLADKYEEAYGPDFQKLVSDLKGGKITELTKDYAFMELSRTQPISRIEMPLAYLKHPNARSYLWLKSFTMKQLDLVRRDAYNEMKKGGPANIARGMKNLASMGVVLGLSGATTEMVKDWMKGKNTSLKLSDVPINMFKTFGFSEHMKEQFKGVTKEEAKARRKAGDKNARAKDAQPISAIANAFKPPFEMFDRALTGDPTAIRYLVPGAGPYLADQVRKEIELEQENRK